MQHAVSHSYTCIIPTRRCLDRIQNLGLYKLSTLDDLATGVGIVGLAVGLEEFGHVDFGSSENLGFADVDVVEGVNALFVVSVIGLV